MKNKNRILMVTPYVENENISFNKKIVCVEDDNPSFGDMLIDMSRMNIDTCQLHLASFNSHDKSDSTLKHTMRTDRSKLLRVRIGESLIISNISGSKYLQLLRVPKLKKGTFSVKFLAIPKPDIWRERLAESREYAQRQDQMLRDTEVLKPEKPSWFRRALATICGGYLDE